MGVESWSTTPGSNNASPPNGAPEGMAPSAVNDVIRQIMADVRAWLQDAEWLNWGHTPTRVDADTFTVATDLTAVYHVGRRLKFTGSATAYGSVASVSYSAPNTTVNLTMEGGASLPATLSTVYVSILSATAQSNSFTATMDFGTGSDVTGTMKYKISDGFCTLYLDAALGGDSASRHGTIVVRDIPTAARPSVVRLLRCLGVSGPHSASTAAAGAVQVNTDGTMNLYWEGSYGSGADSADTATPVRSAFLSTGIGNNNGLAAGWTVTYPL
jgi:hypothetical protein